jgi:hypothetical protein
MASPGFAVDQIKGAAASPLDMDQASLILWPAKSVQPANAAHGKNNGAR